MRESRVDRAKEAIRCAPIESAVDHAHVCEAVFYVAILYLSRASDRSTVLVFALFCITIIWIVFTPADLPMAENGWDGEDTPFVQECCVDFIHCPAALMIVFRV